MSARRCYHRSGFTLIELSIVLVIVGLIIGGVLVGQDLIKAARIRAVVTEVEKIKAAVNTYQVKFNALPGDDPKAESIWGTDTQCDTWAASSNTHQATCNGNGDRNIGIGDSQTPDEHFRFWQQLANASLIEGQYSGTNTSPWTGYCNGRLNQNMPASKYGSSMGYTVWNYTISPGGCSGNDSTSTWYAYGGNTIYFIGATNDNIYGGGVGIPRSDAQQIDAKMDDGLPGTGQVRSQWGGYGICATSANPTTAIYQTSQPSKNDCALYFINSF